MVFTLVYCVAFLIAQVLWWKIVLAKDSPFPPVCDAADSIMAGGIGLLVGLFWPIFLVAYPPYWLVKNKVI